MHTALNEASNITSILMSFTLLSTPSSDFLITMHLEHFRFEKSIGQLLLLLLFERELDRDNLEGWVPSPCGAPDSTARGELANSLRASGEIKSKLLKTPSSDIYDVYFLGLFWQIFSS